MQAIVEIWRAKTINFDKYWRTTMKRAQVWKYKRPQKHLYYKRCRIETSAYEPKFERFRSTLSAHVIKSQSGNNVTQNQLINIVLRVLGNK